MKSRAGRRGKSETATIYDVADMARVSAATVSRAMTGSSKVAEPTLRRIRDAVRELGYQPNAIARSLVTKTTQTIGLLLPDLANPFFPELVQGVQSLAGERSYMLLLAETGGDPDVEQRYLDVMRGKAIDGVLVAGLAMRRHQLAKFVANGIPIVSFDRDVDLPRVAMVLLDNRAGGRSATQHLTSLGHRSIAHIAGPKQLRVSEERRQGYRDALRLAGLRGSPALEVEADFTEEGGRRACLDLLDGSARFSAIFAANDVMAIGAMAALREREIPVPAKVSVVGFDDIHLARYASPALTTIRQPTYEMGRRATEVLIDTILGQVKSAAERVVLLQGELVVRESTSRFAHMSLKAAG